MSCHTWVYKRIDSMSREEINQEIDCVINERLSRAYMSENEEEYANKMVKLTKDSSISPLSYSDAICSFWCLIFSKAALYTTFR